MTVARRTRRTRRLAVGTVLAVALAVFGTGVDASAPTADVALAGSQNSPVGARLIAPRAAGAPMLVSLVLAARGGGAMERLIAKLTTPASPLFHHWLTGADFNRRFGPTATDRDAARSFLARAGLHLQASPSPFIVRASGTTEQVRAAFNTGIDDYRAASGARFYANAQPAHIPASLAKRVIGVSGLTSTVRLHSHVRTAIDAARANGTRTPHYGGGPGGSGLTPSQLEGIYSAGTVHASPNGRGEGTTLAVFELSGYTPADVEVYQQQFFGSARHVPVTAVKVDGGPVHPVCPTGDSCGPFDGDDCADGCNSADFSGDVEVEADIEVQIAMAPAADRVLVYNAPNDFTGATSVDELFKMANDNLADVISSSWGLCEPEDTLGTAEAEYVAFAQMAAQGQSVFGASGDSGAYDCFYDPDHKGLEVDDPPSQPYMTAVGGSSMGTYDPGTTAHPAYPQGHETVWNPLNACHGTVKHPVGDGCANTGASGGGVSRFWPRPGYQKGIGVASPGFTQKGPYCSTARDGQRCREIPDVSANADQYTPYAEYCSGSRTTAGPGSSSCASYLSDEDVSGWLGIGGTSLSAPVWSAIVDLSIGYHGERFGEANVGLYRLFNSGDYAADFHDMTGRHQTENNNGYYPTTAGFDMATGIGTPNVSAIAMAAP